MGDTEMFTTISEMINGNTKDFAGFGTLLDNLYEKNKRYFSILKDYEIMPILIPQINRVLMFLVNECISPDIQNSQNFTIKYTGPDDNGLLQKEIDKIKKEAKLDNLLREVYTNRYKLGREYYTVEDYDKTFQHMADQLKKKKLNEATAGMPDGEFLDKIYSSVLSAPIDEITCTIPVTAVVESTIDEDNPHSNTVRDIADVDITWSMTGLNIIVERSQLGEMVKNAYAEVINEAYSSYRPERLMEQFESMDLTGIILNEAGSVNKAPLDMNRFEQLITTLQRKKVQRSTTIRFDPARIYKLKIGGKIIGYLYVQDINESSANMVNFAQSLKDQLLKSRATNLTVATKSAEEVISKELAERIINTFDPNLGISRIEDVDLLHDFIRNNEIYKGNKRITFYYADEIYDMSRADDSILTNAVFFTKLYATLLLNNIITKVLRGRGRQIHTVTTGASPNTQRYLDNAMAALAMPETNLGAIRGTFEQIMNPFNAASDIVIPAEEASEQFIRTDYIPGQDIDMNDEFLKTILKSIITSFNLDAAILDATNGNLQFARTLTMESLQISTSIRNEQQDLHPSWNAMCLRILDINGSPALKEAISNGQVETQFFEPKSLIIQNTIEDLNNFKNLAEYIADLIPIFNEEGMDRLRDQFVFRFISERSNYDFATILEMVEEVQIAALGPEAIDTKIRALIKEYMDNTKEVEYGKDGNGGPGSDGLDNDSKSSDVESTPSGSGQTAEPEESEGEDLTDEEKELMAMEDDEVDDDEDVDI
ncbi:MAG: hypothetical protein K2F99_08285 [Muribaculaceae bacterium]|nr:hypothetical protein [Muribaculaceae bacterium]